MAVDIPSVLRHLLWVLGARGLLFPCLRLPQHSDTSPANASRGTAPDVSNAGTAETDRDTPSDTPEALGPTPVPTLPMQIPARFVARSTLDPDPQNPTPNILAPNP